MATKAELGIMLTNSEVSQAALRQAIESANGSQSALLAVGTGFAAISAVGYMWYRRVNKDRQEDKTLSLLLAESANAAKMWREIAEASDLRATEAHKRADEQRIESMATIERLAIERNDAVQIAGKLTATVGHLQETVENQTITIESLEIKNAGLQSKMEGIAMLLHKVLKNQAEFQLKIGD